MNQETTEVQHAVSCETCRPSSFVILWLFARRISSLICLRKYIKPWIGLIGGIPLPNDPDQESASTMLKREVENMTQLEIRPETKLVGNDQGLNFVDFMKDRFGDLEIKIASIQSDNLRMQEDNSSLKNKIASMENEMAIIHSSELLKHLPFEKRVNTHERNEFVHGGQVRFDLQYLDSVDESCLLSQGLTKIDVEKAFEKRYLCSHDGFRKKDLPPVIERIINKRSALEHLRIWKDLDILGPEYVYKRDNLKFLCDRTIGLWFDPPQGLSYSNEDANAAWNNICKEHDTALDSIKQAMDARREE